MVVVVLVYQLEVLDAGLVDTAIEVEHECLHLCFSKNMSEKGRKGSERRVVETKRNDTVRFKTTFRNTIYDGN